MIRAVALVREHQELSRSVDLYGTAQEVPGVIEAYPSLGSQDGIVFLTANSLRDLRGMIHHLESLDGVDGLQTLIEDEDV